MDPLRQPSSTIGGNIKIHLTQNQKPPISNSIVNVSLPPQPNREPRNLHNASPFQTATYNKEMER